MKRRTKKVVLSFAIMLSVFPFFTNCSEPMKSFESSGEDSFSSTTSPVGGKTSAVNERALLSADQVLKSMSSVTGIEIDSQITDEYARQQDVLSGSFNLDTVTPPMLIGITNLAAKFCNKLVTREAAIAFANAATRKQFKTINFSLQPAALAPADYTAAINSLAQAFWGRDATTAEITSLSDARTAFINGRDAARAVTQNTNSLMIYVCTGMLSSFESYTF